MVDSVGKLGALAMYGTCMYGQSVGVDVEWTVAQ
jgi:hypothetical protein